jgi:uroporphyrinogen decarboxylase
VDRVGLFEVFWQQTARSWADQGQFEKPETVSDHFRLDVRRTGGEITPMPWKEVTLAVDLSEQVNFQVKDRHGWKKSIEPLLLDERTYDRRIRFNRYQQLLAKCTPDSRFMTWGLVGAVDLTLPMCGHEYLLIWMVSDRARARHMADIYAALTICLLEILFSRKGAPGWLCVWDDLEYKNTPFMSPTIYREILFPACERLFDFTHRKKLPAVLHSDGLMEALVCLPIEAWIGCFQPINTQRWNGSFDAEAGLRQADRNDRRHERESPENQQSPCSQRRAEKKPPDVVAGSRYVLQVGHSASSNVTYETYRHFVDKGLQMGKY